MSERVDPETMAQLLEGTLGAEERARVMQQLARSPEDYEQFLEASALLRDGEGDKVTPIVPRRSTRPFRVIVPLLAAAGIVGVIFMARGRMPSQSATESLAQHTRGTASFGADWSVPAWSATRGADDQIDSRGRAFRVGVRWADLDLSLRAADTTSARGVASSLSRLVEPVGGAAIAARIQSETGNRVSEDLTTSLRRVVDPAWFDLGAWVETARLAARAGSVEFFNEQSPSKLVDDVAHSAPASDVQRLRAIASTRPVAPADLPAIAASLEQVIRDLAR